MLPSLSDIRYFIEASHTLNFSRAAERLGIRQSSLSQAIQRLEDSLEVALFVRGRTGVTLTKSGQLFYGKCRSWVEEWDSIHNEVTRNETEIRGSYSLGCHPSIGVVVLPLIMPRLTPEYPELDIRLDFDTSRIIMDRILQYKTDFGILVNPMPHPDLVMKLLWTNEIGFWMKNDEKVQKRFIEGQLPLFTMEAYSAGEQLISRLGTKKAHFSRVVHCSSLEVITALVAAGAGAGIISPISAKTVKNEPLKKIPGFPTEMNRNILAYRSDMRGTAAAKKIIEVVMEITKPMTSIAASSASAAVF